MALVPALVYKQPKVAFVCGANGIGGHAIVEHLVREKETEWSKIIISSRTRPDSIGHDRRLEFLTMDLLDAKDKLMALMGSVCQEVTHAFFTSYSHSDDFMKLPEKNIPLFKSFLEVIDMVCPKLERICMYTGGKYYGGHLGPVKVPSAEDDPRYEDEHNFYYAQEDMLQDIQRKGSKWTWNIIRPLAIVGFTPHANGMTECLTISVYFWICRELGTFPHFIGSEFMWDAADEKSFAPGVANLAVFAATHDHCANQIFNHTNGDVIVWKYFWPRLAEYFGGGNFEAPAGKTTDACNWLKPMNIEDWSKDKCDVWKRVVKKYGGREDAFDMATWGITQWSFGRTWPILLAMHKARTFGWSRIDDTLKTWMITIKAFEDSGILPRPQNST